MEIYEFTIYVLFNYLVFSIQLASLPLGGTWRGLFSFVCYSCSNFYSCYYSFTSFTEQSG